MIDCHNQLGSFGIKDISQYKIKKPPVFTGGLDYVKIFKTQLHEHKIPFLPGFIPRKNNVGHKFCVSIHHFNYLRSKYTTLPK